MAQHGTPWGKICTVLGVVILLVGTAAFYSLLAEGREASGGGVREKDGQQLQKQIDELRRTLSKLAAENEMAKIGMAECSLKRQELVVCTDNLAKTQREIGRCQKWATDVDDENQARGKELDLTNQDLQQERKRSAEAEQRVFSVSEMLEKTKIALKEIEVQKLEATAKYETERQKEIALEGELKKEKELPGGGSKARVERLQKLIDDMNQDLSKKELRMTELMQEKKESDRSLRKLENKLMEAGVDPVDIKKVGLGLARTTAAQRAPSGVNPAALAALQVAASKGTVSPAAGQVDKGTATAEVELLFDTADANNDRTLDLSEVLKVVAKRFPPNILEPERQLRLANAVRLFKKLDLDSSGFVNKAKALRHPRTAARLLRGQTSLVDMAQEAASSGAAPNNFFSQMLEQQKQAFALAQANKKAATDRSAAQQRLADRLLESSSTAQQPRAGNVSAQANATLAQGLVQPVLGARQALLGQGAVGRVAPIGVSAPAGRAGGFLSSSSAAASLGGLGLAESAALRAKQEAATSAAARLGSAEASSSNGSPVASMGGMAAASASALRAKGESSSAASSKAAASLGSAGASLGIKAAASKALSRATEGAAAIQPAAPTSGSNQLNQLKADAMKKLGKSGDAAGDGGDGGEGGDKADQPPQDEDDEQPEQDEKRAADQEGQPEGGRDGEE